MTRDEMQAIVAAALHDTYTGDYHSADDPEGCEPCQTRARAVVARLWPFLEHAFAELERLRRDEQDALRRYPVCAFCYVPTAEHPEPLCSPGVVRELREQLAQRDRDQEAVHRHYMDRSEERWVGP